MTVDNFGIEICDECGKPKSVCTCKGEPEKGKRIEVEVRMTSEMKELQQKLFEAEQKLKESEANAIMAMEAANENAEKAKELDEFKRAHPPSGKATNVYEGSGSEEQFTNQTAMIDELYNRAYYKKNEHTPEQQKDAKKKIETLLESTINSPSWEQLRHRGSKEIQQHEMQECPECHATKIDTDTCPSCGYNPREKKRVQKVRIYKGVREER